MANQKPNVFFKVDDIHRKTLADGKWIEYPVTDTTDLGYLPEKELRTFAQNIRNTDFTDTGYCMRHISAIIVTTGNDVRLDLKAYTDVHSNKCRCTIYPSDCPFVIAHGECKHPLVIELIGKKFYPALYTKEHQEYLKGIER